MTFQFFSHFVFALPQIFSPQIFPINVPNMAKNSICRLTGNFMKWHEMTNIINESPNENCHNKTFNEKLIFWLHPITVEIAPDGKKTISKLSFDSKSYKIAFNVMGAEAESETTQKVAKQGWIHFSSTGLNLKFWWRKYFNEWVAKLMMKMM